MIKTNALLTLIFFSQLVCADWVQVTGQAPYKKMGYELAREKAREDALQQAALQVGGHVKSEQKVVNGVLKHDQVSVSSQARVNRSVILDEYTKKGVLYLSMNVDVDEIPTCPESQASHYKKQVVVLGFSVQSPEQTRFGAIHDINRGLSGVLNQALHERGGLVVFQSSQHALYEDLINAPSSYTEQQTLTKAAAFAKQTGAQFVVSGVVRDLGFEDEAAFGTSYWSRLTRFQANTMRRFSVDVFVHDGFSGSIIWQKNFALSAKWTTDMDKKIGIAFLKEKIVNLSDEDKDKLTSFAKAYPPKVRALLGAILEVLSLDQLSESLKEAINYLSRYDFGISQKSLPTISNWNIT